MLGTPQLSQYHMYNILPISNSVRELIEMNVFKIKTPRSSSDPLHPKAFHILTSNYLSGFIFHHLLPALHLITLTKTKIHLRCHHLP